MGVVYRARQAGLERDVALKVLLTGEGASPEWVQRFLLEARAASRLRHDHLVEVLDVGQEGGIYYYAMEYVPGRSLAARIASDGAIPADRAARLLRDAARGGAAAHAAGIVHRDLKPSNLLLDGGDRILVADFGVAKVIGQDSSLTRSGAILGTPLYMPCEQFEPTLGGVGPWSDVYALGATLWHALAGRPPFDPSLQPIQLLAEKDLEGAPRLSRFVPGVPRDLETIVQKAMEREPRRRYPDAGAFADDLDRFLSDQPILARPPRLARRVVLWGRRHPVLATFGGILAAVAVFASGWGLRLVALDVAASRCLAEGDARTDAGDFEGAIAWYDAALRRVPGQVEARRRRELAVELAVGAAIDRLESGEDAGEADALADRLSADPLPPTRLEARAARALAESLGEHEDSRAEHDRDLEAARTAGVDELGLALVRLEERTIRLLAAPPSDRVLAERKASIAASARPLVRLALLADDGPSLDRLERLLVRLDAPDPGIERADVRVVATSRDWVGGESPVRPALPRHGRSARPRPGLRPARRGVGGRHCGLWQDRRSLLGGAVGFAPAGRAETHLVLARPARGSRRPGRRGSRPLERPSRRASHRGGPPDPRGRLPVGRGDPLGRPRGLARRRGGGGRDGLVPVRARDGPGGARARRPPRVGRRAPRPRGRGRRRPPRRGPSRPRVGRRRRGAGAERGDRGRRAVRCRGLARPRGGRPAVPGPDRRARGVGACRHRGPGVRGARRGSRRTLNLDGHPRRAGPLRRPGTGA